MTLYDSSVPSQLKDTQLWFASIITTPLTEDQRSPTKTLKGKLLEEEAPLYIRPNRHLTAHERIQIYNQQYWWRLLKSLRHNFATATRLLGSAAFDSLISVPYLLENPPQHWSLEMLGAKLPQWVYTHYKEKGRALFCDAVAMDWALTHAFIAEEKPALNPREELLTTTPLFLQAHVHLLPLRRNLLEWRALLLEKEEDGWIDKDLPPFPESEAATYAIYRIANQRISWKKLDDGEALLLHEFQHGASLDSACATLENTHPELVKEAEKGLPFWSREWRLRGWLYR